MGDSVSAKRHASPQDNSVPSPVEWDCGTISSSSEICADGSPHRPDWIDELPWVLLDIRTVPKEDLECSSAEMVYGAPLTVSGDFLPRGQDTDDVTHLLPRLREPVRKLAPHPPVPHGTKPSSVPTALAESRFVFVRRDSHRPPLTPPYESPYKVLVHGDKSFVLDYGTRQDSASIDRLKPAFVDPMTPIEAAKRAPRGRPPTGVDTRSGRLVRPPELPVNGCRKG